MPPRKLRRKGMLELAGTGDDGTTALLGGGRVPKDDLRIETYGTVDEASSAIGLAKALTADPGVRSTCEELQRGLYRLGSELSTAPGRAGAFATTSAADVERLEVLMREFEAGAPMPTEFILPGATPGSGALDLARAVVRRAERLAVGLARGGGLENPQVVRYLNRLSLLLFVLGRVDEARAGLTARTARQG